MEISILLIKQIISLSLIGIAGFWLRKMNFISHEGSRGLTAASVYICMPCTLFVSSQTDMTSERMTGFVYAITAAVVLHIIFFAVMKILRKPFSFSVIEYNSIVYSNAGNLIIPLVTGVFGAEYVFYTSAYIIVQNLLLWSYTVSEIGGRSSLKKILLHPCMLAILGGMLFMAAGWHIPSTVSTAMSSLAACIGPIAMLTVGILIAEIDLREILANRRIYLVSVFRLIIYPLIAMVGAYLVWKQFDGADHIIYLIVVLGACGPTATTITQMAQLYDNEPWYASSLNVFTTLGSLVTIPLMMTGAQILL